MKKPGFPLKNSKIWLKNSAHRRQGASHNLPEVAQKTLLFRFASISYFLEYADRQSKIPQVTRVDASLTSTSSAMFSQRKMEHITLRISPWTATTSVQHFLPGFRSSSTAACKHLRPFIQHLLHLDF